LPGGGKFTPMRGCIKSESTFIFNRLTYGPVLARGFAATFIRPCNRRIFVYQGVGHVRVDDFTE
jgi:hypothetical protein